MKNYISESRAIYEDNYHGLFSKKLAEWAISNMQVDDPATKTMKPLKQHSVDEMKDVLKSNKIDLPDEFCYTAWYLYNMTFADYPKTITTDSQRAYYIEETLLDPDGMPENVLDCFVAKMRNAGKPIYWEDLM
jgi:hypothetical protein